MVSILRRIRQTVQQAAQQAVADSQEQKAAQEVVQPVPVPPGGNLSPVPEETRAKPPEPKPVDLSPFQLWLEMGLPYSLYMMLLNEPALLAGVLAGTMSASDAYNLLFADTGDETSDEEAVYLPSPNNGVGGGPLLSIVSPWSSHQPSQQNDRTPYFLILEGGYYGQGVLELGGDVPILIREGNSFVWAQASDLPTTLSIFGPINRNPFSDVIVVDPSYGTSTQSQWI